MRLKKTGRKSKIIGVLLVITMILQCLPLIALANANTAAVGQWQFNEGTGKVATDASGNGNNGKICGATWVDGKVGKALSFDGNDYVEIPHRANLNPCNAISVEAWINPASMKVWQRIVSKSPHPNTDYSMFIGTDKRVGVSVKMGKIAQTVYSAKNTLQVGTWTHVVGTYDGCRMRLYINGKQVNSFPLKGKINVNKGALRIGGDPQGDYFQGIIDEVSIYDKALTACEVLNHYQAAMKDKEVEVPTIPEVETSQAVAAGYNFSMYLKNDGTVWAWGDNEYGQLGDSPDKFRTEPVQVKGLTGVKAVSTEAFYSLALKNDGTVWGWSYNFTGQLGNGTKAAKTTLVQAKGLTNVKRITAGHNHSMAVKNDGTVWAWGYNYHGQLGDGTTTSKLTPVQVKGLTNVKDIGIGFYYSIALKNDGTVWAWGDNNCGQLGDGTKTVRIQPVQVKGLTNIVAIAAGANSVLALKNDGTVWAWGSNAYGQVGDGTTEDRLTPVQVKGLTNVAAVEGGSNFSLALKNDGTVWTWGNNAYGQLGDSTDEFRTEPVRVKGLTGVKTLSAGSYHCIVQKTDGTVWAWGNNESGQLGDGTTTDRYEPVRVNLGL